jgi:hypothetical protein
MLDLIEEYGSLIVELIVAIIVFQFIMSLFFVPADETNLLKEVVQEFVSSLSGN